MDKRYRSARTSHGDIAGTIRIDAKGSLAIGFRPVNGRIGRTIDDPTRTRNRTCDGVGIADVAFGVSQCPDIKSATVRLRCKRLPDLTARAEDQQINASHSWLSVNGLASQSQH